MDTIGVHWNNAAFWNGMINLENTSLPFTGMWRCVLEPIPKATDVKGVWNNLKHAYGYLEEV